MTRYKLFLILGQSNTGKSTIFKRLMNMIEESNDNIKPLKSCTTRPMREEDKAGSEYDFVTKEYFTELHKNDGLLEYAVYDTVYGTWFYFTRKSDLDVTESNYIKIINPEGFAQIKDNLKGVCDIVSFEIVSSEETRLKRAMSRNDGLSIEEIERRFKRDKEDFKYLNTDYKVVNDDGYDVDELAGLIYQFIKKHK